jgi:hypothetical protein
LTFAALGTIVLFGAAAAAGVNRGTEMMESGITVEHVLTDRTPTRTYTDATASAQTD